jgi:hypothetical protein
MFIKKSFLFIFSVKRLLQILTIFMFSLFSFAQSPQFGDHPVASSPKKAMIKWQRLGSLDLKSKKPNKKLKFLLKKPFEIVGFIIPIEYEKKLLKEFLLVPYVPSCMHVPPPPDNQIIHVKLKKAKKLETPWYPIKAFGKVSISRKKDPEAIYEMKVKKFSVVKL